MEGKNFEKSAGEPALNKPVLVLNANYQPLSWYPLSVISWKDAIKAFFMGRVHIAEHYEDEVRSPSITMNVPSVVVLNEYIPAMRRPAFNRVNLYLRDMFECQYCGKSGNIPGVRRGGGLTLDHVIPKCNGGGRGWLNMVASCGPCNGKKGGRTPKEAGMHLRNRPHVPTVRELWNNSRQIDPTGRFPEAWVQYLGISEDFDDFD